MNIFPQQNLLISEFEEIKTRMAAYCISNMGKDLAHELKPTSDFNLIKLALDQTQEFKRIIENGEVFPYNGYEDISRELNILRIENSVLSAEHCLKILSLTKVIHLILKFFKERESLYENLELLIEGVVYEKAIVDLIEEVFDDHGVVKSSASPELAHIRKTLQRKRLEVDRVYQQVIARYKKNGWVTESEESTRSGRRVISIVAEQKRTLNGIVHDISATGKTAYLEPEEAVGINSIVQSLEQEERLEILRILRELTQRLRKFQSQLQQYYELVAQLDFIHAKAAFAIAIKAHIPFIKNSSQVVLNNARHPLLFLQNQSQQKKTIPFSLTLNDDKRIIVISGPNAGGKTVCMKATALLQLMLQSGLLVSVDEASVFGIFENVLVDIGDSQSIEYELSTYSSRLQKMKQFLETADERTLFIIDEFGTGTDPELGGALAEAILEELNNKHCYGLITTHFLNLKVLADKTPGIFNGCMLFDSQKLEPKYELVVGKPGSSYTFVVAERSGLPKQVISNAENKVTKTHVMLEQMLQQVEHDKNSITQKLKQVESAEQTLNELLEKYERLRQQNENSKIKFDEKVKSAENRMINEFDAKVLKFVNEWNNSKNKKQVLEKYKRMHSRQKTEIEKTLKAAEIIEIEENLKKLNVGVWVRLKGGKTIGKIESIQNKKANVFFGTFKTIADLIHLVPVEEDEVPKKIKEGFKN
ncbi:MAG: DNA mismatch repair protein MutS [Bacteroidia bacterium]